MLNTEDHLIVWNQQSYLVSWGYSLANRCVYRLKWKDFEKSELSVAFDQLGMHLSIDNPEEETKENVLELLKHRIRHQRHRLNKHFGKFTSLEEAIRNKPYFGGLTQANWELLCTNLFSDPQYQERCKINRNNRKKMITNHNQGSRSFVAARHILSKELEEEEEEEDDDDGDEEVDRIKFYKHCHYKEGKGWATPQCDKNYVEMERRRTEVEESGEKVDADKIADDVLGKRSSYIVGLGYGPKPKKIASNSTMKMLEERLKEKEKANLELKDRVVSMETTHQEYGRLIQQLMESQQRSKWRHSTWRENRSYALGGFPIILFKLKVVMMF
ncbi:PREDICTED: uncharacterized protein LOC105972649 isoform X1 [Erythranthe guttata]|uniref:uncharacterized protein LOC105972649 isoform X1 n=1 Tax=Erythranthe guttata TaxID=4155 RepID=UPI00064DEB32|nr:PREDICTED: uncharacterized protein LOC105972649 isoform X1 [Erythranthe guttata]XP_012853078.1 PREDICTED: uncharacterized protein LOC105972649 isoform X1 [Erythranthe guttata]XP_012853079.1 PREDICTED: uncharacterized protein LOC105972649 isoform X1 [Erythranthe guttata]|eukprot:XP_012853077.1 PREDICTED: uncharacterized protein LOC105972649 isoform X1 [Erythranthe guttata]